MEISFRLAESRKEIDKLSRFLLTQPLGYPNYFDWVERAVSEFELGYKQSILGFYDGTLVSDLVFQPAKDFPDILCELKNGRTDERVRRDYFLRFSIRAAERLAREQGYQAMICDTRSDNLPIVNLLKSSGYSELLRVALYDRNVEDVVFVKKLVRGDSGLFVPVKKSLISRAAWMVFN